MSVWARQASRPLVVLCPGQHTTASMLFRLFYPVDQFEIRQVVFSEIMPALSRNEADLGVCIHEGRFTWADSGLGLVADLGTLWERETRRALPLGGLVGRRELGRQRLVDVQRRIRQSIDYGLEHREETLGTMRTYAQELSDSVIYSHVDLYVNRWTQDLGEEGWAAVEELNVLARRAGAGASRCPQAGNFASR